MRSFRPSAGAGPRYGSSVWGGVSDANPCSRMERMQP